MNDIRIRAAENSDCDTIAEFNLRLAAETERKQLDPQVVGRGVRALLADPRKGRYFVACAEGRIVGQLMHTREWSDWRDGEIWWLQSVYVVSESRRRGVFRGLFRHVEELARNAPEVVGLRLYVERENHRAQDAYRQLGLHAAGYEVLERFFPVAN